VRQGLFGQHFLRRPPARSCIEMENRFAKRGGHEEFLVGAFTIRETITKEWGSV
jgi:hypothetical protein